MNWWTRRQLDSDRAGLTDVNATAFNWSFTHGWIPVFCTKQAHIICWQATQSAAYFMIDGCKPSFNWSRDPLLLLRPLGKRARHQDGGHTPWRRPKQISCKLQDLSGTMAWFTSWLSWRDPCSRPPIRVRNATKERNLYSVRLYLWHHGKKTSKWNGGIHASWDWWTCPGLTPRGVKGGFNSEIICIGRVVYQLVGYMRCLEAHRDVQGPLLLLCACPCALPNLRDGHISTPKLWADDTCWQATMNGQAKRDLVKRDPGGNLGCSAIRNGCSTEAVSRAHAKSAKVATEIHCSYMLACWWGTHNCGTKKTYRLQHSGGECLQSFEPGRGGPCCKAAPLLAAAQTHRAAFAFAGHFTPWVPWLS